MDASLRRAWVPAALLVGAVYLVVGRAFALPEDHVRAWRLAAWIASGVVYAAHIGYEHFRLRSPPRATAVHAAVAVAIGALGLAVVGMVHSLATTSALRPAWLLALLLWPVFAAVPAFLGALLAATILARVRREP